MPLLQSLSQTEKLHRLDGLTLGGRQFHFLGYSMSALREHTFWFLNPFEQPNGTKVTVDSILSRIGDFGSSLRGKTPVNHYPALYPARAAQAFSATEGSILIQRSEITEEIEDVVRNGYTFTDGVGTISPELAEDVWTALLSARHIQSRPFTPSAFQIRLCGFKGVLVVDHRLEGRAIHFKQSMKKFDVHGWNDKKRRWPLEIARSFDRPMRTHLNRSAVFS